ncbi:MAG TPA: SET domain-containing methyltransferase [Solirubrobacteraceae bacterium]
MPHVLTSTLPDATASRGGSSSVLAEREASTTQFPEEEGVELRSRADGKGDGVLATRPFAAGETVMVGFLIGALTDNNSHATQVGPSRWALHGGLGPKVNHSCDPNCGVRLNDGQAFDFIARRAIGAGQELTFDYAMRNFTIDHFPATCLCGAAGCRGSVTGWKDLPAARKADYGELVAPYLRLMDDDIAAQAPLQNAM